MPLMDGIANSRSALLNPDRNPLLRRVVRVLFYNHFAAGENDAEVRKTVATIKGMGFKGVILGYAKEQIVEPSTSREEAARWALEEIANDNIIHAWRGGIFQTLSMLEAGDFLAIKLVIPLISLKWWWVKI
jgi:proline dehydrogenase